MVFIIPQIVSGGLTKDGQHVLGDRAFKCSFEGCGRLYTTHHHLRVGYL